MTADVIAIALGLAVGLSLGALGGGGSTLAVPILVFVAGMQAQDATTASLLVVGAASAIGAWGHYRNGNVRLGAGLAFGAAGIVGSRIGTYLNRSLDEQLLLLAFSALIFFVAIRMYRSVGSSSPAPTPHAGGDGDSGGTTVATRTTATPTTATPRTKGIDTSARALVELALAATGVGLLTGLFGVGGGFAVVPALALLLGFPAKEAIGTSLVVIAINASIALSMRWGELGGIDWTLVLAFLGTVTAGVIVGSRVAHRLDADKLTRAFSIMLGAVAVYTVGGALL